MNKHSIESMMVAKSTERIRHFFTEEELATMRETFLKDSFKLADVEERIKNEKQVWKEILEAAKDPVTEMFLLIRNGFEDKEMEVAFIPNYDNGMMEYWTLDKCEKVLERKLRPEERQMSMKVIQSEAA